MYVSKHFDRLGGIVPACDNRFLPLSEAEAARLEMHLSCRLPEPYRAFAVQYGLSSFGEWVNFHSIEPIPEWLRKLTWNHFASFFGGHSAKRERYSVDYNRIKYHESGRVPASLLPIGDDGDGNLLCVGISGEYYGKIFYWHYKGELTDEEFHEYFGTLRPKGEFTNVQLVANDFEDFLSRLYVAG